MTQMSPPPHNTINKHFTPIKLGLTYLRKLSELHFVASHDYLLQSCPS